MNAKLIHFEVKDLPALKAIGKEIVVGMEELQNNNPIPAQWEQCLNEGMFEHLAGELKDYLYNSAYIGYMLMINEKQFVNLCGILAHAEATVPEGYVSYDIPAHTAGIAWIQGKEPDIYIAEHTLSEPAMDAAGYKYDMSKGFSIEVYDGERYTNIDQNGDRILDYYAPLVKK